jgi:uncharacterized protein
MWFHKRFDFFQMLLDQARMSEEGLRRLCRFVQSPSVESGREVEAAEKQADDLRRDLIGALNRTFITPIDREDIFALSRVIDDMVDYANTTVEEMMLFEIEPDESIKSMARCIHEGSQQISLAVESLRHMNGRSHEHIIRAKKFENQTEHLYREGLAKLFKNADMVTVLKMREIYRHLSNAADRGDEAADIISDILVKNA